MGIGARHALRRDVGPHHQPDRAHRPRVLRQGHEHARRARSGRDRHQELAPAGGQQAPVLRDDQVLPVLPQGGRDLRQVRQPAEDRVPGDDPDHVRDGLHRVRDLRAVPADGVLRGGRRRGRRLHEHAADPLLRYVGHHPVHGRPRLPREHLQLRAEQAHLRLEGDARDGRGRHRRPRRPLPSLAGAYSRGPDRNGSGPFSRPTACGRIHKRLASKYDSRTECNLDARHSRTAAPSAARRDIYRLERWGV